MKKEENEVEINSELLNKDYDDINYNQEQFDDEGIDEGFASQIGYWYINMKANSKKGLARKGSLIKQYTVIKNKGIAKDANEKVHDTRFYRVTDAHF